MKLGIIIHMEAHLYLAGDVFKARDPTLASREPQVSEHAWWAMVGSAGLELSKGKGWDGYKAGVCPTDSCLIILRGKE